MTKTIEQLTADLNMLSDRHALAMTTSGIGVWDWVFKTADKPEHLAWDHNMHVLFGTDPLFWGDGSLDKFLACVDYRDHKAIKELQVTLALKAIKELQVTLGLKVI